MAHDALQKLKRLLGRATPEERAELTRIARQLTPAWVPLFDGPQRQAYDSAADVLFYGGAAGGGKTDLVIGAALTRHRRSIIFRRVGTELQAIIDRMTEILGTAEGYSAQRNVWRLPGRQVEFGAVPVPGDEKKYQGRPHDLKVFDEITSFTEAQFRFLVTWLRTTDPAQRCRVICTGNPPVDSQGEWVIRYWAPWLDKDHPDPAAPGELRWFAVVDGKEVAVASGEPFRHDGKEIRPRSRTFIPSRVQDNPFLMETGYEAILQALPEPLRSRMLEGDFTAGREENPFQVIPSAWVAAAQKRWSEQGRQGPMDAVGQDVARGGRAETVIARRHGAWYDQLICCPGSATPDGPSAAALAMAAARDGAPIHVDVIGCGTSPYDHLNRAGVHVVAVNGAAASYGTDRSGQLRFHNLRAELWWKLREALDPTAVPPVSLPPGPAVRADLCAPTWTLRSGRILIESKEDLMARIGRSPDRGDAIVYASVETPKRAAFGGGGGHVVEYDPLA